MKPDYQVAATEVKDVAIMAAVNVDQVLWFKPTNLRTDGVHVANGHICIVYCQNGPKIKLSTNQIA